MRVAVGAMVILLGLWSCARHGSVAPQISEITMYYDGGLSMKPCELTLTLWDDGTAETIGGYGAPRYGTYRATLPKSRFVEVSNLIKRSGFDRLAGNGRPGVDLSYTAISTLTGGERKTIFYSPSWDPHAKPSQPAGMAEIEKLIESDADSAKWVKVSELARFPGYLQ